MGQHYYCHHDKDYHDMTDNETGLETAIPDGWPEKFADPTASCAHLFHWDDSEGQYRCIYCDSTREEPPI